MNTELIVIITLIICGIICHIIDRIHLYRIEDKIDELKEEIKVLENKKTNKL